MRGRSGADSGHERPKVAFHVAAIVKACQGVGDRRFDTLLETRPQVIRVALPLDLGANARQQLMPVDRPHDVIVYAHVQAAHQARIVAGLDQHDDRQVAGAIERADLAAETQAVGIGQAEAHDQQVEIVLSQLHQRGVDVALGESVVGLAQGLQQAGRGAGDDRRQLECGRHALKALSPARR